MTHRRANAAGPDSIAGAVPEYRELFASCLDGAVAPACAPVPADPAALAKNLKASAYFLDATLAGVCLLKAGDWHCGETWRSSKASRSRRQVASTSATSTSTVRRSSLRVRSWRSFRRKFFSPQLQPVDGTTMQTVAPLDRQAGLAAYAAAASPVDARRRRAKPAPSPLEEGARK